MAKQARVERVGEFEIIRGAYHGVRGGRVWVLVHDEHGDCGTYRSKSDARLHATHATHTIDQVLRARARMQAMVAEWKAQDAAREERAS